MNLQKLYLFLFICLMTTSFTGQAQQKKTVSFAIDNENFLMNGKKFQIISGEMHPQRIPKTYWKHRIQMAKAMGCNTIAVYIFWNDIEETKGQFDFTSKERNIAEFVKLCQQENMWVIMRPGPYVCGEWDFGGLPPYLLSIPDIKIRCTDSRYITEVKRYIDRVAKEIVPLQCTNGGPIVMLQIENEYGSYGNDKAYLESLKKLWLANGIKIPFYTADGPTAARLEAGTLNGAVIGLDSGSNEKDFKLAQSLNLKTPIFSSETYPGWLTHWGKDWAKRDTTRTFKETKFVLETGRSLNFYVIHGGTNFGFTAGANSKNPTNFLPDVTSYDYDAPINEQGQATEKYYALRKIIAKNVDYKLPAIPKPIPTMELPEIEMSAFTLLWDNLPEAKKIIQPQPMETLGQSQGFIVYSTQLIGEKSGKLTITEPHDFAYVFLDGKYINTIQRNGGNWTITLPKTEVKNPRLDIVVEAMGHINYGQYMIDRKGITDRVTLNEMTLMNWEAYSLPFKEDFIKNLTLTTSQDNAKKMYFFKGNFNLSKTADTYIDMSKYQKGLVWVNGHNLGRYWNAGPQTRLYCPAPYLNKGKNEIIIFDMLETQSFPVKGFQTAK